MTIRENWKSVPDIMLVDGARKSSVPSNFHQERAEAGSKLLLRRDEGKVKYFVTQAVPS